MACLSFYAFICDHKAERMLLMTRDDAKQSSVAKARICQFEFEKRAKVLITRLPSLLPKLLFAWPSWRKYSAKRLCDRCPNTVLCFFSFQIAKNGCPQTSSRCDLRCDDHTSIRHLKITQNNQITLPNSRY